MRIKRYTQFINEDFDGSVGEWIESVAKNDDYLLNIVSQYTQDVDPTVRLSNAINVLEKSKQTELHQRVKDYVDGIEQPLDVDVDTSIDASDLMENTQYAVAGKNVFKSFLKVITALGLKEHNPDWNNTPESFLIYYLFENVEVSRLKMVLSRFKSFSTFSNQIEHSHNNCHIYFGIKTDSTFEYGFRTDVVIPVGRFSLSKSVYNWILLLDSPSSASLKKEIVSLDVRKIQLFSKIKKEMANWKPGYFEKKSIPQISSDDVMSFGFKGVGRWSNGKLDVNDFENIKNNFKVWLSKYKWSERILVSVTCTTPFWVYFNFKIK